MFGTTQSGAHAYAKVGIETGVISASPHKLIVMLYDGAIVAISNATQQMKNGDIPAKGYSISKAIAIIESICAEAEVGKTYKGKVMKIAEFGAFVEILPNTQGLLHISELANERVRQVTDVVQEGDMIDVKVLEVDRSGRIKLSRKALLQ